MNKVIFNIRSQLSPTSKCLNSSFEFLTRFLKYIHSTGLTVNDLETKPALEVLKLIIGKTFILSLEKDADFNKEGFIKISGGNLVFINDKTMKERKFLYHNQVVKIQNLKQPLFSKINNQSNCNLEELFLPQYEEYLKDIVVSSIFSRYQMYTKYSCLKRLAGVKWTNSDDIRWAIKEVELDMGITEKEFLLQNGSTKIGIAPLKKIIHNSTKGSKIALQPWEDEFPEEKSLLIQGGESGLVFSKDGNYLTAFVEVFPQVLQDKNNVFSSFIRGEGKTFQEAELEAFNRFKQAKACLNHEWELRGRVDGCGFCKHCKVFNSNAFPELKKK